MNNNFYNEIKSKVDIIDVISKYVSVTKKSSGGTCICPFHNDTTPSCSISSKLQIFNCFVCNTKGDAISFVAKYENIPYFQAAKKIIEEFNLGQDLLNEVNKNANLNIQNEREYFINEKTGLFFHNFLFNKENKFALEYLKNRQIDQDVIEYFHLGFAPENDKIMLEILMTPDFVKLPYGDNQNVTSKDLLDIGLVNIDKNGEYHCVFKNRIIFPIYDANNHLIAFSGRSIDNQIIPKYLNTQTTNIFNKESILYNYQNVLRLDNYSSLYLVEGYMDVIGLYRIGIKNAIATMGVALTENHLKLLKYNSKIKTIILAYDNDKAGRDATLKAGKLIGKEFNVFVVKPYQHLAKDFDELYCNVGKQKGFECANNLIDFVSYALILLATEARTDHVKMNDFLNQAFEIIYKCGHEIEYLNYFNKIKELFDKSIYFKDKYTIESIKQAYTIFENQKQQDDVVKPIPNFKKEFKPNYYSKNKLSKNNFGRYSSLSMDLNSKEYNRLFVPYGKQKEYIDNPLFNEVVKQKALDNNFEIKKDILINQINGIENNLLACFFKYKSSILVFEKINDINCSFLTKERQQLYKLIKQWYHNNPQKGTMIYDFVDPEQLCQNNQKIINTYYEMKNMVNSSNIDQKITWELMVTKWLSERVNLLITIKNKEIDDNPTLIYEYKDELNKYRQLQIKYSQALAKLRK